MSAVTLIRGPAAFLQRANVDTDTIIRLDRLREIPRDGLGSYAFEALRFDAQGREVPDFVLNEDRFRHSPFLLTGPNFGCGSSREGAVWALKAYGIRCIISPGFGDIFFGNCFQNSVLPIVMPRDEIELLSSFTAEGEHVELDLQLQQIRAGTYFGDFKIDPLNKSILLNGTDAITETKKLSKEIADWQTGYRLRRSWTVI